MDSRSAAVVLTRIARLLELHGENRFKARAYDTAAKSVLALDAPDLAGPLRSGALAEAPGIGPATLSVLEELVEEGRSRYLEQLHQDTPEGLLELLAIPGLGTAKIHALHQALGITSIEALEQAARDGRLAALKGFGARTAEKILKGIAFLRASSACVLFPRARTEAERLVQGVRGHPAVARAEIAGSIRRRREVIGDVDIVAACREDPAAVAAHFAGLPGVEEATRPGAGSVAIRFVDGVRLDLHCVEPARFALALWRATGSEAHVRELTALAEARGLTLADDELRDATGAALPVPDEAALYRALGLAFVPPELREGRGELDAAARDDIPVLVEPGDLQGILHCHSDWSDGKASIADMVQAAMDRGWRYLGITDHSAYASYAGGLSREQVARQHDEIDALNARLGDRFRVLKGIEADILPDGRMDYGDRTLDAFDYVIASVHSRFGVDEAQMTARVLAALDDPRVTVLGHPTGRLLLAREPYAIDMHAVIEKAAEVGAAVELNADPHRLDLDWRLCREARDRGVVIEIGPDAHSPRGLDNVHYGIGIARKGWLRAADVLNTRSADEVLAFARRRKG